METYELPMVIISLILILIRLLLSIRTKKKLNNVCKTMWYRSLQERDYKNRTTNWWIKLVSIIFILIICYNFTHFLLQKKMKSNIWI
jgi:predicted membrane protein